jgi:hypothetical protein
MRLGDIDSEINELLHFAKNLGVNQIDKTNLTVRVHILEQL